MRLFGRSLNHHRGIRNVAILIATFFTGYLLGVNMTATNCFYGATPTMRIDRRYCDECSKRQSVIDHKYNNKKNDCVWKLSTVIASLEIDEVNPMVNNSSFSEILLDDDEKQMKKNIESTIISKNKAGNFVPDAVRTSSKEFFKAFDFGYPTDNIDQSNEILMLYNGKDKIPTTVDKIDGDNRDDVIPFLSNPFTITDKCQEMNVVMTQTPCLAISMTASRGSFHVQRWSRHRLWEDKEQKNNTMKNRLVPVSRGLDKNYDEGDPPERHHTQKHWARLNTYLSNYEETMKDLLTITERIKINNTIIVMVSNFGHSELLYNFVCSAKSRKLDISNILVFATDEETFELTKRLGMEAYMGRKVRPIQMLLIFFCKKKSSLY